MKKKLIIIIILLISIILIMLGGWFYLISAPSKNSSEVVLTIDSDDTYSTIYNKLKSEGLIRSTFAYRLYIKLNTPKSGLEAGEYNLNKNLKLKDLISKLEDGTSSTMETVTLTFKPGENMRKYIRILTSNFNFTEKEITSKLSDSKYLDSLINKYWFLTNDIKNKDLYYSLEGYLYPDTYEFYKNSTLEEVFSKLLDNMSDKLNPYKSQIDSSKYSIHEMLTLASIVELEAGNADDRKGVAGVFYNRLNAGWSLGSDVTTYYAAKIDLHERDLYKSELNDCNKYNTRSTCMNGKLPVGPICNMSVKSIEASINPSKSDYYYFVADKNGKTYFNKTDSAHVSTINKLKKDGLWFEY